jgi:hypothetical protein
MRHLKFVVPVLLVLLVEALFELGAWERLAKPESHAGMSITKKLALEDPAIRHIDFVTLGSSRPVYGIDHALLASNAAARGYVHVNLSVAGMHWMSLGVITNWLSAHHPEVRGGVIALTVQDLLAPGNGSYELGIAYPFHTLGEIPWMSEHVPFNWHDPATYGLYSALFQYHEDVQDYLRHPEARSDSLTYYRSLTAQQVLTSDLEETSNLCNAHINTLNDCADTTARDASVDAALRPQCKLMQDTANGRYDLRPFLDGLPLTGNLQKTRDLVRAQLRALSWPEPPVVVLMPMHSIWLKYAMPEGTHEWALSILTPLANEGKIRLLDYTDLFNDVGGNSDCSAFLDFYHNNASGRGRLMQLLVPELNKMLFPLSAP